MRYLPSFCFAWIVLLPVACTSVQLGRKALPEGVKITDLKTKQDVLKNLGGPSNVRTRGDLQVWIYTHTLGGGGGFGVGNYAIGITCSNVHLCADTAMFLFGADGQVIRSLLLKSTDKIDASIWPF